MTDTVNTKKQMLIFLGIAFALPYALGILMGFGYYRGIDISAFPNAQMLYPAAGAMLAALVTRRGDNLIPRRFFVGFLIITALMLGCALASIVAPDLPWNTISQMILVIASVAAWILLLTEKQEKRIAYGLKGGRWKAAALITLIYLALYFARTIISYVIGGEMETLVGVFGNPLTWINIVALPINYFLVFVAFFGEEYGWRYYLQPIVQKKYGMIKGVLLLGVVWGLWHLPINFFYYSSPTIGIISLTTQLVTCITLGVFYGWAYLKTDNIWTVVILHFVNNNLVPIITGNYAADVLQNQEVTWDSVLFSVIVNGLLFMGFLLSKYYKNKSLRLPTMDERADEERRRQEEALAQRQLQGDELAADGSAEVE